MLQLLDAMVGRERGVRSPGPVLQLLDAMVGRGGGGRSPGPELLLLDDKRV